MTRRADPCPSADVYRRIGEAWTYSGVLSTAGGLTFSASGRVLFALDAPTGRFRRSDAGHPHLVHNRWNSGGCRRRRLDIVRLRLVKSPAAENDSDLQSAAFERHGFGSHWTVSVTSEDVEDQHQTNRAADSAWAAYAEMAGI
jgi:hypothetical protein